MCVSLTFPGVERINPIHKAGKINLCSPDHISLLVHRTFNVSIPRHHIITDTWVFEYGPAESDPEFGAVANQDENEGDTEADAEADKEHESEGKWVHKVTGEVLGGKTGLLEFTVIGYVIDTTLNWFHPLNCTQLNRSERNVVPSWLPTT